MASPWHFILTSTNYKSIMCRRVKQQEVSDAVNHLFCCRVIKLGRVMALVKLCVIDSCQLSTFTFAASLRTYMIQKQTN